MFISFKTSRSTAVWFKRWERNEHSLRGDVGTYLVEDFTQRLAHGFLIISVADAAVEKVVFVKTDHRNSLIKKTRHRTAPGRFPLKFRGHDHHLMARFLETARQLQRINLGAVIMLGEKTVDKKRYFHG